MISHHQNVNGMMLPFLRLEKHNLFNFPLIKINYIRKEIKSSLSAAPKLHPYLFLSLSLAISAVPI